MFSEFECSQDLREREGGRFPSQDSHKAVGAETGSHVNRRGVLIFSMRKYAGKGYQSPESPLPTLRGDINYANSYGHCRCLRGNDSSSKTHRNNLNQIDNKTFTTEN